MSKVKLKNDGERMVPALHKNELVYAEHMTRYIAARPLCKGKVVLDIASGSGYGSNLLSETASKVYGVEIDPQAVAYAEENYGRKNIEFKEGSATDIPLADNSVDVVVTFETIEHIKDYKKFMMEIKRVLKADGIAIISTPNDLEFAEGNHFHLHEFQYEEFKKLISNHFKYSKEYFQATWKAAVIGDQKLLSGAGTVTIPVHNQASLPLDKFLYFYFICSDQEINVSIEPMVALGGHYSDRQISAESYHNALVVDERNRVIVDKDTELSAVHAHTDQLQAEIDHLRSKLESVQAVVDRLYNSNTYKVTHKLKTIVGKVRKNS